jgi:hypothetical protein
MEAMLFLNDEKMQAKLLLENGSHGKPIMRESQAVASCRCDRWGHPVRVTSKKGIPPNVELYGPRNEVRHGIHNCA